MCVSDHKFAVEIQAKCAVSVADILMVKEMVMMLGSNSGGLPSQRWQTAPLAPHPTPAFNPIRGPHNSPSPIAPISSSLIPRQISLGSFLSPQLPPSQCAEPSTLRLRATQLQDVPLLPIPFFPFPLQHNDPHTLHVYICSLSFLLPVSSMYFIYVLSPCQFLPYQ